MLNTAIRTMVLLGTLIFTSLIPSFFPPTLTGLWQVELRNEVASEQVMVSIEQQDAALTGTYVGSYQLSDLEGRFDGDEVQFEYIIDGVRVVYTGELKGQYLSGTYYAGAFDRGEFKARRLSTNRG